MFKMRFAIAAISTLPGLFACGDDGSSGAGGGSGGGTSLTDAEIQAVVDNYAVNVHANYADALSGVEEMRTALDDLVLNPSQSSLMAARDAWNAARPAYLQSEVYRFYNGPIDNEEDGPEGRINGWPLDELYIDYVEGMPTAGIINDPATYPTISKETIAEANEAEGEKALSAGFHAIEFLLWGQDQSDTGPGARPHTDYVTDATGTADNQERRGLYLREAAALLNDDVDFVTAAWAPDAENYAATFTSRPPREALRDMIQGMGSLAGAELSTERMNNAYEERDQEEEHSCFSDTTHIDHLNDLIGIENVYLGRYDQDGPGVDDLVKKLDPALDTLMKERLTTARAAIQAIPVPFDQAIQDDAAGGGREKVKGAIDALYALADTTVDVATALGVELTIE